MKKYLMLFACMAAFAPTCQEILEESQKNEYGWRIVKFDNSTNNTTNTFAVSKKDWERALQIDGARASFSDSFSTNIENVKMVSDPSHYAYYVRAIPARVTILLEFDEQYETKHKTLKLCLREAPAKSEAAIQIDQARQMQDTLDEIKRNSDSLEGISQNIANLEDTLSEMRLSQKIEKIKNDVARIVEIYVVHALKDERSSSEEYQNAINATLEDVSEKLKLKIIKENSYEASLVNPMNYTYNYYQRTLTDEGETILANAIITGLMNARATVRNTPYLEYPQYSGEGCNEGYPIPSSMSKSVRDNAFDEIIFAKQAALLQ